MALEGSWRLRPFAMAKSRPESPIVPALAVTSASGSQDVELGRDRYDAVVFDMDGVITDTARIHAAAWESTFDSFLQACTAKTGTPQRPFDDADYLVYVDGKARDDGVASFLASRGIELRRGSAGDGPTCETVWGLANRKNREFQRLLGDQGVRPYPTSVTLVRALQQRGIGTAVISASRNCQQVLEAAGIGDLFRVRVDGLETERLGLPGKPAPAVFLEAAQRLGAGPDRTVVVEDAIAGVQAGRNGLFGLVIGVDRVGDGAALRDSGADFTVHDLGDIHVREQGELPAPAGIG
jgi:alpha,alpha-trehalase